MQKSCKLYTSGIAEGKVADVIIIQIVCDVVAHKELDGALPSVSMQGKLAGEMKALARQHIRETASGRSNLTLKYDGTTKAGKHLTEVELFSGDQILLAGTNTQ